MQLSIIKISSGLFLALYQQQHQQRKKLAWSMVNESVRFLSYVWSRNWITRKCNWFSNRFGTQWKLRVFACTQCSPHGHALENGMKKLKFLYKCIFHWLMVVIRPLLVYVINNWLPNDRAKVSMFVWCFIFFFRCSVSLSPAILFQELWPFYLFCVNLSANDH